MRMLNASGIGTYIRNIVPEVISLAPDLRFALLGPESDLTDQGLAGSDHISLVDCRASVYSAREQIELFRLTPRGVAVFWAPHYNIPVLHSGKLLVTVHDLCHLALSHHFSGLIKQTYARSMFYAVRMKADKILCVSRFTKNELMRLVHVPEDHVEVVHCGVSEDWFRLQPGTRLHPKPYILYVGNVKPHKNVQALVAAFDAICHRVPHDLVIIGRRDFPASNNSPTRFPVSHEDRLVFTGWIDAPVLQQYVVQADALVLPSLYEGFGLTPLEAMACGCPTVVSNTETMREVLGEATVYFDPHDCSDIAKAIVSVLTDEELRSRLRCGGRMHARLYSWTTSAQRIAALLRAMSGLPA